MAEDEVPRAKRLKLLREAKARKERQLRGEEEPAAAEEAQEPEGASAKDESAGEEAADVAKLSLVATGDEEMEEGDKPAADTDEEEEEEELTLAPKRANWDIERDIAPLLKKLEKRTQHAIVEILRAFLTVRGFVWIAAFG